jgi:hypothetical protein
MVPRRIRLSKRRRCTFPKSNHFNVIVVTLELMRYVKS